MQKIGSSECRIMLRRRMFGKYCVRDQSALGKVTCRHGHGANRATHVKTTENTKRKTR